MNRSIRAALFTVGVSVALPLVSARPAAAVMVTIGPNTYDLDVFTGSQSTFSSLFQSISPGKMPWWGDATGDTASKFAKEVFNQLGVGPKAGYGPVFAYDKDATDVFGIVQSLSDPLAQDVEAVPLNADVLYAIVNTPLGPPASVPAPLPIVGAMGAYGWSRRIRKRISAGG